MKTMLRLTGQLTKQKGGTRNSCAACFVGVPPLDCSGDPEEACRKVLVSVYMILCCSLRFEIFCFVLPLNVFLLTELLLSTGCAIA